MKNTIIILFSLLTGGLVRASNDSLNFYVINHLDTVYINDLSTLLDCNYSLSTERAYDKCLITIKGDPYTGDTYYRLSSADGTIEVFDGEVVNGQIKYGTIIRYSATGHLKLTGQYFSYWK